MNGLPVLNYHGIESREGEYAWLEAEKIYVLSIEAFKKQLEYLAASGRSTLSLDQLKAWLKRKGDSKSVLLTFDDGHVSHFEHVAPVLKANHFSGIFFISAALVGRRNQMDWGELRELVREGFEIGSHGLTHIPLTRLLEDELTKEIYQSKKILEDRLGIEVKSFSVPRGFYHSRITTQARAAGYRFLFTSQFELVEEGDDPLGLARLAVKRGIPFETFSRMVEGDLGSMKYSERLKEWTRRWVPPAIYTRLAETKSRMKAGAI